MNNERHQVPWKVGAQHDSSVFENWTRVDDETGVHEVLNAEQIREEAATADEIHEKQAAQIAERLAASRQAR